MYNLKNVALQKVHTGVLISP